jgi:hypothetical protein
MNEPKASYADTQIRTIRRYANTPTQRRLWLRLRRALSALSTFPPRTSANCFPRQSLRGGYFGYGIRELAPG